MKVSHQHVSGGRKDAEPAGGERSAQTRQRGAEEEKSWTWMLEDSHVFTAAAAGPPAGSFSPRTGSQKPVRIRLDQVFRVRRNKIQSAQRPRVKVSKSLERERATERERERERERGGGREGEERCSGVFVSLIRTLRRRWAVWSCRSLNVRRRSGVETEQNTSGQVGKINTARQISGRIFKIKCQPATVWGEEAENLQNVNSFLFSVLMFDSMCSSCYCNWCSSCLLSSIS